MKSIQAAVLGVTIAAMLVAGCSKDSTSSNPSTPSTTTPPIAGTWTVISGPPGLKHLHFKDDNTFLFLNQRDYGLRDVTAGIYQVSGGTVDLGNNQYPSLYAYTLKNDTLTLYTPSVSITTFRNAAAPADTQWVRPAGVIDSITAPTDEATDISINNTTMWYGNAYASNHLYRIDLVSRAVDSSLDVTVDAWALEWDGTHLWASSDGSDAIYQINTSTGATVFTSKSMGAWIQGIAWDGSSLWCTSANESSLYRYNPATDAILATYRLNTQPSGAAFAGGYLYLCVNGVINKCTTAPFAVVNAWYLPGSSIFGIAFDGASFWVTTSLERGARIYKVSLP